MTEDGHQRLQRHAGVHKAGGVGVAQHVRGDAQRLAASAGQPGSGHRVFEAVAQAVGAQTSTSLHEQELRGMSIPRMGDWSLTPPVTHPLVEGTESLGVEGNGALGGELAKGHLHPGAVRRRVPQTVELEIQQLSEAEAGAPQDAKSGAGEGVVEPADGCHQIPVDIGSERPWQRAVEARHVRGEEELASRPLCPTPDRDVLEEGAQIDDGVLGHAGRHRLVPLTTTPARVGPCSRPRSLRGGSA